MSKFRTRADRAFETKVKAALANRDWPEVEHLYGQLGAHLGLIQDEGEPQLAFTGGKLVEVTNE